MVDIHEKRKDSVNTIRMQAYALCGADSFIVNSSSSGGRMVEASA